MVASDSDGASVLIEAVDSTDIQASISANSVSDFTNFGYLSSAIDISRDTQVSLGDDSGSQVILDGLSGGDTGLVKVRALSQDGSNGGIFANASSLLFDSSSNTAVDNVIAYISDADLDIAELQLTAESASTYIAQGKITENDVSGTTLAYISDSLINASAPADTDAGVLISAIDNAVIRAVSSPAPVFDFTQRSARQKIIRRDFFIDPVGALKVRKRL